MKYRLILRQAAVCLALGVLAAAFSACGMRTPACSSYARKLFKNGSGRSDCDAELTESVGSLEYPDMLNSSPNILLSHIDDGRLGVEFRTDADGLNDLSNVIDANTFSRQALILFALNEKVTSIEFSVTDGTDGITEDYSRVWADYTAGGNILRFGASAEKIDELLEMQLADAEQNAYMISRLAFGKEQLIRAYPTGKDENELCRRMIDDYLVKSASYQGPAIESIESCFRIREIITSSNDVAEYYAYIIDGRPAIQYGTDGRYGVMNEEDYAALANLFS